MANITREIEEEKVNAITIALAGLAHDPKKLYTDGSFEITAARAVVRQRMMTEIEHFSTLLANAIDGPLSFFLSTCTALAIAMYAHGDLVLPDGNIF